MAVPAALIVCHVLLVWIFPETSVSGMIYPCMEIKKKQSTPSSRNWMFLPEQISARNVANAKLSVPNPFPSGKTLRQQPEN